jgi:hypothetical protein
MSVSVCVLFVNFVNFVAQKGGEGVDKNRKLKIDAFYEQPGQKMSGQTMSKIDDWI